MQATARFGVIGALVGATLGAAVAQQLHSAFAPRGGPYRYFVYSSSAGPSGPDSPADPPTVPDHSHWLPALPLWIVGGVLVGAIVGAALARPGNVRRAARVRLLGFTGSVGAFAGLAGGALVHRVSERTSHTAAYAGALAGLPPDVLSGLGHERMPWLFALSVGVGLGLLAGVVLGIGAVILRLRSSETTA